MYKNLDVIHKSYLYNNRNDEYIRLVASNDSLIFFWSEKASLLVFNWKLEKEQIEINKWQNKNPNLPFYIPDKTNEFVRMFGRYNLKEFNPYY